MRQLRWPELCCRYEVKDCIEGTMSSSPRRNGDFVAGFMSKPINAICPNETKVLGKAKLRQCECSQVPMDRVHKLQCGDDSYLCQITAGQDVQTHTRAEESRHLICQILWPFPSPELLDNETQGERPQRTGALELILIEEVLHCQRCQPKQQYIPSQKKLKM